MTAQYPARVWQQTSTTGTGTITLSGSDARFRTFGAAFGSSARVFYVIVAASGFELGVGLFTNSGSTLTRDRVIYSSNAGALVNLPSGTKDVFATFPGAPGYEDGISGTSHTLTPEDHGNVKLFFGSSGCVFTLLGLVNYPSGWMVPIVNAGTSLIFIDPDGSEQIQRVGLAVATSLMVPPGQSGYLYKSSSVWRFVSAAQNFRHGGCYLDKNGSDLRLSPAFGDGIQIQGVLYSVKHLPGLAPSGVSNNTVYSIYAYLVDHVVQLEYSTTGPAVDTAAGNEGVLIKTGDASRSYVGQARTNGSAAWVDTAAQRFVLSHFNRRRKTIGNGFTTNRAITASSFTEFHSEIRCEFLTFADEPVNVHFSGVGDCSLAATGEISIGFDGATPEDCYTDCNSGVFPVAVSIHKSGLSSGYHYATLIGKTIASGPLTIKTNANDAGRRSAMSGAVMG